MTTRARAFYLLKKTDKSDFIRLFKSDFIRLFKIWSTALIWTSHYILVWITWLCADVLFCVLVFTILSVLLFYAFETRHWINIIVQGSSRSTFGANNHHPNSMIVSNKKVADQVLTNSQDWHWGVENHNRYRNFNFHKENSLRRRTARGNDWSRYWRSVQKDRLVPAHTCTADTFVVSKCHIFLSF